jgi:selenocysteine lyase/cysteine desulfurase
VEFFDTVSRAMALLLGAVPWRAGDRLLVARHEWGAVAAAAQQLAERCAVTVETIPCAADTTVDTRALAARLDERVRAVCLPLHTAVGGRPTLGLDLPRPAGCLVFGDAAQALGQMPFDLENSGYDVVVGTARKWLRGPRGIAFAGFSTAGRELMRRALWLGGASSTSGVTSDYTRLLRLGLGAAAAHCLELGIENVQAAVRGLAGRVHDGLASVQGVQLFNEGPPDSGIVAFTAGGREAALVEALGRQRIRVALIQARYHPGLFQDRRMQQVVRISPHVFNTHQEIDRALEHVAQALAG